MKWDESDFELKMQNFGAKRRPQFQVEGRRVLDAPKPRTKDVASGYGTIRMEVCYHGKLVKFRCSLCEFEAPRL